MGRGGDPNGERRAPQGAGSPSAPTISAREDSPSSQVWSSRCVLSAVPAHLTQHHPHFQSGWRSNREVHCPRSKRAGTGTKVWVQRMSPYPQCCRRPGVAQGWGRRNGQVATNLKRPGTQRGWTEAPPSISALHSGAKDGLARDGTQLWELRGGPDKAASEGLFPTSPGQSAPFPTCASVLPPAKQSV